MSFCPVIPRPALKVRALTVFGEPVPGGLVSDSGGVRSWPISVRQLEKHLWESATRLARFARADLLRADFLVTGDGRYYLNEACSWLWPNDGFYPKGDLGYQS